MVTTIRKPVDKPPVTAAAKSLRTATPRKSAVSQTDKSTQSLAKPQSKALGKPKKDSKEVKAKKPKLVRDRFAMPKIEYSDLDNLKQRGAKLGHPIKKNELLRAAIKALAAMSDDAFLRAVNTVLSMKPERPKDIKAE